MSIIAEFDCLASLWACRHPHGQVYPLRWRPLISLLKVKKHWLPLPETSGVLFFLREGFFGLVYLDNPLALSFVLLGVTLIIKKLVFLLQNHLRMLW